MINELEVLNKSEQVYDVVISDKYNTDNEYWAGTDFNTSNGNVEITIPTGAPQHLVAHEFKHAYQFEMGSISFPIYKKSKLLYDYTDEVEAYERSSLISNRDQSSNLLHPFYNSLLKDAMSIESFINTNDQNNSMEVLQKLANRSKSIFRWDGKTYNGKK